MKKERSKKFIIIHPYHDSDCTAKVYRCDVLKYAETEEAGTLEEAFLRVGLMLDSYNGDLAYITDTNGKEIAVIHINGGFGKITIKPTLAAMNEYFEKCYDGEIQIAMENRQKKNWCEAVLEKLSHKPKSEWTEEDHEAYDYAKGTLESERAERAYLNGEEE